MKEKIKALINEINNVSNDIEQSAEEFRIVYLGKKGVLQSFFDEFKTLAKEDKREIGQLVNTLKVTLNEKYQELKELESSQSEQQQEQEDLSKPSQAVLGSRHPLSIVKNELIEIFSRLGYTVSEGPEVENDWHNFTALNFPPEHPARDMQDTFFIHLNPEIALRTHTSSVQVRVMESAQLPIRTISPGRVYRNETISARSHCFFHQVEGLYIDENVSFADLKQTLFYFAQELFGEETKIRFRPSYFPFTEPSAEMDISCHICGGKGCNVCKYSGWVEILGCGMVDPHVLENCHIDSKKYTGFAFGMGVERIAMLKYQINDIRLFFENDLRFLQQFQSTI